MFLHYLSLKQKKKFEKFDFVYQNFQKHKNLTFFHQFFHHFLVNHAKCNVVMAFTTDFCILWYGLSFYEEKSFEKIHQVVVRWISRSKLIGVKIYNLSFLIKNLLQ